jgi:hypothetical protein
VERDVYFVHIATRHDPVTIALFLASQKTLHPDVFLGVAAVIANAV